MSVTWHDVEQGSDEWHELRSKHYCASETPTLLEAKKTFPKTPKQLAQKKRGLVPQIAEDEYSSKAMSWGHENEPYVRQMINDKKGFKFVPKVASRGKFLASLDGYDQNLNMVLEIKCPYNKNSNTLKEIAESNIPKEHELQIQHQLLVTRATSCLYVVMHPETKDLTIAKIEQSFLMQNQIESAWRDFEPLMSCEPDELLEYEKILYDDKADIDKLFKLINNPEYKEAKHRYEQFKEHEKLITELKTKIKKKYESPVEGFGIRIRFDSTKTLDRKKFAKENPEINLQDYEISKAKKVFVFTGGNE